MKPSRLRDVVLFLCMASALAAESAPFTIPAMSGALNIDGKLDDPAWQGARVFPLASSEFSLPFPAGGEARIATRGAYLCLSALIPEQDRVVAHATGRNPSWWSEDLITWTIRFYGTLRRNLNISFTVNPLGAYRLQNAATGEPLEAAEKILVATSVGRGEWVVEAAIPLERLAQTGFIDVQRVRASRPDAPELRWYWPAPHERATFQLAALTSDPPRNSI